jgi:tetratricopeptide (TPR) repeat protein
MAAHQETADVRARTETRALVVPQWLVSLLVGGITFWLAYDNGSYAEPTRHAITIAVWWGVIVALAFGLAARRQAVGARVAVGGGLAMFAVWTLASTAWATDAARAFSEFDRVSLYVGVFTFCSLVFRRRDLGAWCDGIGFGIVAVAVFALVSRLFPDAIGRESGATILPALKSRLSYPVGYWNGLGMLCALGLPLVLATATGARPRALRAAAAGAVPLLGTVIYLTSSRGAVATAIVGLVIFVALTPRRWLAFGTLVLTGVAAGIAVAVVERHPTVANGGAGSTGIALSLLAIVIATVMGFAGLLSAPVSRDRTPPAVGWSLAAAAVVVVVVVAAAAHPVRRYDTFKEPPTALAVAHGDYVKAHLLSGSGSGRWQFWQAALDEFRTRRLQGRGAGSYGAWWAAHGTLATSIQDAHSLYLETLGELGAVGIVLLLLPLGAAAYVVATRLRRLETEEQIAVAAASGLVCGYLVAAGVDWMWELTAVSIVAVAALAVAVAACTADADAAVHLARRRRLIVLGAATLTAACLAICAAALPLLTHLEIGASQAAARDGRTFAALQAASSAVHLQPWASEPYLQLALVSEQSGRLGLADVAIRRAIARSPDDWNLWLVATRIQTKRGRIAAARHSLQRARSLHPRSPLFATGAAP